MNFRSVFFHLLVSVAFSVIAEDRIKLIKTPKDCICKTINYQRLEVTSKERIDIREFIYKSYNEKVITVEKFESCQTQTFPDHCPIKNMCSGLLINKCGIVVSISSQLVILEPQENSFVVVDELEYF